jgi:dolichol-phosphate mannosyltransferase
LKLSIIIPVYNEVRSLELIVDKIKNVPLTIAYELILVDSGSFDGSTELIQKICEKNKFKSLFLPKNLGKGFCIRQALKVALGDIILIQDADLEYDPNDYIKLLEPLLKREVLFVMGSRHLKANTWRIRTTKRKSFYMETINYGSEFLTKLFCFLYSVKLTDTQTMYKVFYKDLLNDIELKCNGFDLDWEILSKLILKQHIPLEIPVKYESRSVQEGKKLRFFKDGLAALYIILKIRIFKN